MGAMEAGEGQGEVEGREPLAENWAVERKEKRGIMSASYSRDVGRGRRRTRIGVGVERGRLPTADGDLLQAHGRGGGVKTRCAETGGDPIKGRKKKLSA